MIGSLPHVAFITPSYRNDLELVRDLCASLDRFVQFPFEHVIVVPRQDFSLFAELASARRRILVREDLLQRHGFHRLPLPTVLRLPFVPPRRLREQYWLRRVGRVSGWLVQQIVKLSASEFTDAELVVFADSDTVLIRPLELAMMQIDGKATVQQHTRGRENESHRNWRRSAHKLLGISASEREAFNYIGQFVPWYRETIAAVIARVEATMGCDWRIAIAREKTVSEYILYGEYVCELAEPGKLVMRDMELYLSVWSPGAEVTPDMLMTGLKPHMVALHIQSTNPLPIAERRAAIACVASRLAAGEGMAP